MASVPSPVEGGEAWEVVIGMEVHVQPTTRTKMFCGCAVGELGDAPNSNVCEICTGMPGVLPVINKAAVEACLKTALALNCDIPRHTKFDRKNYMYPDLPKGYQISQYDLPMSRDGFIQIGERRVRIRRVHLEEDTGKLIHAGDKLQSAKESFVVAVLIPPRIRCRLSSKCADTASASRSGPRSRRSSASAQA